MNPKITFTLRLILGSILIVFGMNKFFNFMPNPTNTSEEATNYISTLIETGHTFKLIGIIELSSAILFFTNKWIPFALLIIAPIAINILLYHVAVDISHILPGAIVFIIVIILFYDNRMNFESLFKSKTNN